MRRTDKQSDEASAWDLLRAVPYLHMAGVGPGGEPVLRALHGVVHAGGIVFHGASAGDKVALVGQSVVVSAERIVAEIPSHFTHPERACPATTFYRSAMVHGTLVALSDGHEKAKALQALMERFQPEGGYVPMTYDDPRYTKGVDQVEVWKLVPERVASKAALGQGKTEAWRLRALRGLWRTGQVDAVRELAAEWGLSPWETPEGARIVLPGPEHVDEAVDLLLHQYWNDGITRAQLAQAQGGAWVGAVDAEGRLVATARAIHDGGKLALLMDVAVRPDWQGRGVGRAVVDVLVDHPSFRDHPRIVLYTRDAGPFYERLGFVPAPPPPWRKTYALPR